MEMEEFSENVKVIEELLEFANVPQKYVSRVVMAYVIILTGTDAEKTNFYTAMHTPVTEEETQVFI